MTRQQLMISLTVLAALAALSLGTYEAVQMATGARGIRNNNPGNIRLSSTKWQGQVAPAQQTDSSFVQFSNAIYGIRALAKILSNYASQYGLTTISGIISRWAPSSENDTSAYINAVSAQTGFPPDQSLDLTDPSVLANLTAAIITHENGSQPYGADTLAQGVNLAINT